MMIAVTDVTDTPGPTPSEVGKALLQAADVLAAEDPGQLELVEHARTLSGDPGLAGLDDQALVGELGRGGSQVAAAMCRYLELVAEVMVRGIWADHGARTPAQWLSYEVGVGRSTAHDHIRMALRLRELPKIRARLAAGTISYCKVRAITRVAVPALEDMLLAWCEAATGSEIERLVGTFRRCRRGVQDAAVADRQRSVRSRCNGDGTTSLIVRLPDDDAAELFSHLERLVELEDAHHDAGESPATYPQGPAAASPAEESSSSAEDSSSSAEDGGVELAFGPPPDRCDDDEPLLHPDRPRGARMTDALLNAVAAAAAAGGTDTTGMDRHTLVLHAELADLADDPDRANPADDRHVPVHDQRRRVRVLSARLLRRLACEARIVLVATDDGSPIDIGRRSRQPTVTQRRALLARDRSCRFPGCGSTRHLHAHHIVHWADNGPTDVSNPTCC